MLHALGDGQNFERELRIHLAANSGMSEPQWYAFRPSELGFVENERTSWSQESAGSIGSWSTEKYLPAGMVDNTRLGLIWFWQIEHYGSWYWEVSNNAMAGQRANDVYAFLGSPDDVHSAAWKNLPPGMSYRSPPVAVGCVEGGFAEAVAALTAYRRTACLAPHQDSKRCSVIFNDYMNCLFGDPTKPLSARLLLLNCRRASSGHRGCSRTLRSPPSRPGAGLRLPRIPRTWTKQCHIPGSVRRRRYRS